MLGRWRTQSAKHLEEERLNAERERSSSDVASPSSDPASPRSLDASVHSTPTAEPPSTPASSVSNTPTAAPSSTPVSTANETPTAEPSATPASSASEQPVDEEQVSPPASTANDRPIVEPPSTPATPASAASDQLVEEPASTPASTVNDQPLVEPASTPASAASNQPLVEAASAAATPTSDQLTPLALDASTRVQRGTPGGAEYSSNGAYDTPLSRAHHDPDPDPPAILADAPAPGDGVWDTPTSATEHAKGLGKKPQSKILLEAISDFESDEKQIINESNEKKSKKGKTDSISKESYASEQGKAYSDKEILTSKKDSGNIDETSSEDRERNAGESSKDPESSESGEIMSMIGRGTKEKVTKTDETGYLPSKSEDKNRQDLSKSSDEEKPLQLDIGVKESKQPEESCKKSTEQTVPPESGTVSYVLMPINGNRRFQTTPSPHFPKKSRKRPSFSEAREIYRRPPTRFETMNYLSQLSVVQCLQRTYGAAKTNKVTGCALSCMELGVYVAVIPAILFAKICDAPLLCADKVISKSVGSVARVLSCVPKEISCGIPGCNCENPVVCAAVNTQRKD